MAERNPNHGKFVKPEGYTDIGWQLTKESSEPYRNCIAQGHNNYAPGHWRKFDNSLYKNRGTDCITICDTCKMYWHTDMSD